MNPDCPDCRALTRELAAVRAALEVARAYRTLGGPPRPITHQWAAQDVPLPNNDAHEGKLPDGTAKDPR